VDTLTNVIEPAEDRVIPIPAVGKRWNCCTQAALRRLKNFGVPILRFNNRVHGVRLSDLLRLEQEVSE